MLAGVSCLPISNNSASATLALINSGAGPDLQTIGSAVFGSAYEGPPGAVHGGYVAAAFDEVLGYVQSMSGSPGMTGTLTVKYRKPTPIHTELFFEAELLRVEGRKIFTHGELFAGDLLTAEADGLFISVDRS